MKKTIYMINCAAITVIQLSSDVAASSVLASLKQKVASIKKKVSGTQASTKPAPTTKTPTLEQAAAATEVSTTTPVAAVAKKLGLSGVVANIKKVAKQATSAAQKAHGLVTKATQGVKTASQIANAAVGQVGTISKAITGKDLAIVQQLQRKVGALTAGAEKVANKVQSVSDKVGSTMDTLGISAVQQTEQGSPEEDGMEAEQAEAAALQADGEVTTAEARQQVGIQNDARRQNW